MKNYDKSEISKNEIEPLVIALHEKCVEHGLPLVLSLMYAKMDEGALSARALDGPNSILQPVIFDLFKGLYTRSGETAGDLQ